MLKSSWLVAACAIVGASFVSVEQAAPQEAPTAADMAAMKEKAKRFTQPGAHHKALERFLGKWDTETRFFMGAESTPPESGTAEFTWLMEGRWLKGESAGTFMKSPMRTFLIMGYDNFKRSYVTATLSSMDTAMLHFEGDVDPATNAIVSYGTLDEYLTGEHDKMVKSVWRFPSADKIILEVHDLPIGERNTKVFEITYTRQR